MTAKVAVLDFGSEEITVFVGERGLNNTIKVIGMGVSKYSGFIDGEFLEQDKLGEAIGNAIAMAQDSAGTNIDYLLFGVPNDFCVNKCKTLALNFGKKHKITSYDIQDLYDTCTEFDSLDEHELLDVNPVYFTLDNDRRLMDPEGQNATVLGALVSFTLVEKRFTEFMKPLCNVMGVKEVEFTSASLAEILYLFSAQQRDEGVVLVDVGYLTTNVTVSRGDGIICMRSFSVGGGHLTGDISSAYSIRFKAAEKIKRKIDLNRDMGEDGNYETEDNGEVIKVSAREVNQIALHRIRVIAKGVEKSLASCEFDLPDYLDYSLTGGGISFIRGAKEALGVALGKKTEIVKPDAPLAENPSLSTAWALLDMALRSEKSKRTFWNNFFKKI